MPDPSVTARPRGLALMFGWQRLLLVLGVSIVMGLIHTHAFVNLSTPRVIGRVLVIALAALIGFGIFEQWPRRMPKWLARWALQVLGVLAGVLAATLALYLWPRDAPPFWRDQMRLNGFVLLSTSGIMVGPWIAVAALFRQRERERSEFERNALDARLRLLQAQVEPHFLFNTLANVRELVESGSPQAIKVLDNLIAYLRAAVQRLNEPVTTIAQEVQLVRSYLELMHMRMPDRLRFEIQVDEAALDLRCPPTTLLTLVENAVRHGIDPSEDGGRIDVRVRAEGKRCRAEVRDTGVGLKGATDGLGTGLASLRERLQLVFGNDAHLRISQVAPRGVSAEVEFPAQAKAP